MSNYEKYGYCPFDKKADYQDCGMFQFCDCCDDYFKGYDKGKSDTLKTIDEYKDLTNSDKVFIVNDEWVKSITEQIREDAFDACIEVVDKIIDACVKNGGCRSKCDEPYACVYGNRIFGEILALKEHKNDD